MIMARKRTSGTLIARDTILIMYGFFIPLGLSNRGWWGGVLMLVFKNTYPSAPSMQPQE